MPHFAGLVNITPKTLGLMVDISIGINQLITGGVHHPAGKGCNQ